MNINKVLARCIKAAENKQIAWVVTDYVNTCELFKKLCALPESYIGFAYLANDIMDGYTGTFITSFAPDYEVTCEKSYKRDDTIGKFGFAGDVALFDAEYFTENDFENYISEDGVKCKLV